MKNIFSPITSFITKKVQRHEMTKKGLVQPKNKKRLKQEDSIASAAEKSKVLGVIILFIVWGTCVSILMAVPYRAMEFLPVIGQQVSSTVYADMDFSYIDKEKTEKKKLAARNNEPLVYKLDNQKCKEILKSANNLFNSLLLSETATNTPTNLPDNYPQSEKIFNSLSPGLKSAVLMILKNKDLRHKILNQLEISLYHGVFTPQQRDKLFGKKLRIYKGNNIKEKARFATSIPTPVELANAIAVYAVSDTSPANRETLKRVFQKLLTEVIKGNLTYDELETENNRKQAVENVADVILEVKKGSLIMKKGQIVDKTIQTRCNAYISAQEKYKSHNNMREKFISRSLLCLLLIIVSGIYISHVHPEIIESNQKMGLIATVVIISVALNYFAIDFFYRLRAAFDLHPQLITCILPIALGPIVLSAIIGMRVAFFTGVFVSIIAAMQLNNSFMITITGMITCGIAAFAARHRANYQAYFFASAAAILTIMPVMKIIEVWSTPYFFDILLDIILTCLVNAILTTALSLVVLFILEWLFQVTSDMTLLLLCDYNHPLLKRLQMEAPGTYHHSLVVSTLAEHAAKAIGANAIKARVISLFHDIGKMDKPDYFTENQQGEESKHLKLKPAMSCLVILNHVKEGMDMALKYKLRKIIRDGIEQHHGTDTVKYFYQQALEEARHNGTVIDEHEYQYPGPLPKEKEVAILSLADPCEAASRSLQKPTHAKIDALVWEIFRQRIRDGQLDDADLTFGEMKKIRESFVSTLSTMLHGRISYQKEEDNEGDLFVATQTKAAHPKQKKAE